MLSVAHAECCYAECRCTECRGAVQNCATKSLTNPVNFNSYHHTFLEVIDSIASTCFDIFTTAILT
jgi:hypothetical protein